jgi:flagellar motility protein MotE (MotC chaperone)
MIERIRLFPVLAVSAALLGGVKAMSVWHGMNALVPPVHAADAAPAGAAAASAEKPAAPEAVPAPADAASSDTETAPAATKNGEASPASAPAELQPDSDGNYSQAELQLLQSLSQRRAELDKREKDLDMREQVLKVTEKRLQDKMTDIKKIQDQVNASLKTYDDKQSAQMETLVKVYEQMKPTDAARIMSTLDIDVLTQVAQKMNERKIAPIMAAMDSATAKKLTMQLATRRPLLHDGEAVAATQ